MTNDLKAFPVIDLISQRNAIKPYLKTMSSQEFIRWLSGWGHLIKKNISGRDVFYFESSVGLQAKFFIDGNELIFLSDHSTFT